FPALPSSSHSKPTGHTHSRSVPGRDRAATFEILLQKLYFSAACIDREPVALVILPKFALPNVVFGLPNCGVFHPLKASHRNSIRCRSRTRNAFDMDISHVRVP